MPSILPEIFLPEPRNASYNISIDTVLTWIPSRNSESFNLYFWKSKFPQALTKGEKLKDGPSASGEPFFIRNQKESFYRPDNLENDATYYWRIDEIVDGKIIKGPLWHFTTKKLMRGENGI